MGKLRACGGEGGPACSPSPRMRALLMQMWDPGMQGLLLEPD